ncbi:BTAD domain-containing putative transcriptional regulator [Kibdelosporangium phytohabitans]|uniref:BTAD domain-containing putative transcriptional regulator n=1 Tax=Kibdelosporangium phytohabitans TaxID=860235 RepID=UPI0007C83DD0|nr:BTAD domain-containing putative transcriptional regulator [Kibdelosporangium phytohabitans]MBE1466055.1 putative ATPase [Kibdelosporangium phytohabitans]
MRVAVLGPLCLTDTADREIEVGGPRLRMLLVRLALEANRIVPVEALIDGLWGAQPPADATNALQSLVSRLRKTGLAKRIESFPAGYSLAATEVDAEQFERLAAEGSRLLKRNEAANAAEVLRTALALWRGPALVDVTEAPFAAAAVARLAELRLTALEDRIEADILRGHEADVIVELYALTRDHPLRERLTALLIRALRTAGRQADALAAYETARQNLAAELGVDPSPELQQAHLALLRATPAEIPNNGTRLPAQLTSFVGRQHEMTELEALLGRDRLVTLVGPGGAGKTRLATEAASRAANRVWFVHLAGLREAVDVPAALASALGLGDSRVSEKRQVWHPQTDVTTRLLEALADRSELVVLDNCEHLVSAVAHLAETLLAACPRLRILATSREPLTINGETLFPLGPLDLPGENASAEQAAGSAAVRLFLDRARSVRPGFTVDDGNVGSVVAVCRQLDGLPLALELAAARLRSMTVGQVAERLDDRFRLLTGGSRTSLPRHQTLGAVVEWSWGLLAPAERTLASRMSVFANPSTLEAIVAACAAGDLAADDVLYVLASLVEKSFVEAGEGADGVPRYRMLETVKAFAAARLVDAERTRTRFIAWVMGMVEEAEPMLRGHDQVRWLRFLDAERDNVIEAVRLAVDRDDADASFRILAAWTWYWLLRQGVFGEALTEQVLPLARMQLMEHRAPDGPRLLYRMLTVMGGVEQPDPAQIATVLELCHSEQAKAMPLAAMIETVALAMTHEFDGADVAFRRSLRHPDKWTRAVVAFGGAMAAENLGDLARAKRWQEASIRRFRTIGDRWGLAMALNALAEIRSTGGDIAGAIELHEEALRVEVELGPSMDPAMTRSRLAEQHYRMGDLDEAYRVLVRMAEVSQNQGQRAVTVAIVIRLCAVLRARGDLAQARARLDTTRNELVDWPDSMNDPLRCWLGVVEARQYTAEGKLAEAWRAAADAVAATDRNAGYLRDAQSVADVAEAMATIAAAAGDLVFAARLLGASAAIAGALDVGSPDNLAVLGKFGPAEQEVLAEARKMTQDEATRLIKEGVPVPPPGTP